jgi:precorrin-6B methylase 2
MSRLSSDKIDKGAPRVHVRSTMKNKATANLGKEVYKELRTQSWETLWNGEVPLFESGTQAYRLARVGLVRAMGVVALRQATKEQRALTKQWLMGLLQDPQEKVRRYAMAALPKLGGNEESEHALLELLDDERDQREMKHLSRTLDKVGTAATLKKLQTLDDTLGVRHQTEQKVKAKLARSAQPSAVRLGVKLSQTRGLRIHLRTRRGLKTFVRDELLAHPTLKDRFKILKVSAGCVAISPNAGFTLGDLYKLRTFGSINFVLGVVPTSKAIDVPALAKVIASPLARRLCSKLTDGQPRYRLKFMRKQVTHSQTQAVINQAFALCPDLLNDPRQSPWAIDVYPEKIGSSVELRPRVSPDPRFLFRTDDVPASTHPPLAAAMARLAGQAEDAVVWDPFCGSGLELIERSLLGKVKAIIASDIDAKAVEIAQLNLENAGCSGESVSSQACDFRNYRNIKSLTLGSVSLIITNPPLGRRVRVADMKGLFDEIFKVAASSLRPGGRLVILNPLKLENPDPFLKLESRHRVDVGGFECRLEKWVKV